MQYGWEPEAGQVEIAPVDDWSHDDYHELCRLLTASVSRLERRYLLKCMPMAHLRVTRELKGCRSAMRLDML
jgi:hypothetical protein